MRFLSLVTALAAVAAASTSFDARSQVYRCESDSGVPVYQGTPSGKNCKALELAPLTTIPAPKLPPARSSAGRGEGAAAPGAQGADPAFPRVDRPTQRARDNDRRRILEEELAKEQGRLDSLRAEYNNGEPERLGNERNYQKYLDRVERLKDDIGRSEANIASLKRELAAIRE